MNKRSLLLIVAAVAVVALVTLWRFSAHTKPSATSETTSHSLSPSATTATIPAVATGTPVAAPAASPASMPAATPVGVPTTVAAAAATTSAATVAEQSAASFPAASPSVSEPSSTSRGTEGELVLNQPGRSRQEPRIDEITGTRRMILAHAPLRDPKVADPDSEGNRQVLATMLSKALTRAEKKP